VRRTTYSRPPASLEFSILIAAGRSRLHSAVVTIPKPEGVRGCRTPTADASSTPPHPCSRLHPGPVLSAGLWTLPPTADPYRHLNTL